MKKYQQFAVLLLITCMTVSCIKEDKQNYPSPEKDIEIGDFIPVFTVYNKDNSTGDSFSSQSCINKVTLLVFFYTECKDCQRELPKINRISESLKNEPDFQLVTIAREQDYMTVTNYWEQQNFSMPFYLDPDRSVFGMFAAQTIPRVYLIDRRGVVNWMAIEVLRENEEQLQELIENLLAGKE